MTTTFRDLKNLHARHTSSKSYISNVIGKAERKQITKASLDYLAYHHSKKELAKVRDTFAEWAKKDTFEEGNGKAWFKAIAKNAGHQASNAYDRAVMPVERRVRNFVNENVFDKL